MGPPSAATKPIGLSFPWLPLPLQIFSLPQSFLTPPVSLYSFRAAVDGGAGCSLNKRMQPREACCGATSAQSGYLLRI